VSTNRFKAQGQPWDLYPTAERFYKPTVEKREAIRKREYLCSSY